MIRWTQEKQEYDFKITSEKGQFQYTWAYSIKAVPTCHAFFVEEPPAQEGDGLCAVVAIFGNFFVLHWNCAIVFFLFWKTFRTLGLFEICGACRCVQLGCWSCCAPKLVLEALHFWKRCPILVKILSPVHTGRTSQNTCCKHKCSCTSSRPHSYIHYAATMELLASNFKDLHRNLHTHAKCIQCEQGLKFSGGE